MCGTSTLEADEQVRKHPGCSSLFAQVVEDRHGEIVATLVQAQQLDEAEQGRDVLAESDAVEFGPVGVVAGEQLDEEMFGDQGDGVRFVELFRYDQRRFRLGQWVLGGDHQLA